MGEIDFILWVLRHLFQLVILLVATPLLIFVSLALWSDIQARNYHGELWERRTSAFGSFLVDFPFWLILFLFWCFTIYTCF